MNGLDLTSLLSSSHEERDEGLPQQLAGNSSVTGTGVLSWSDSVCASTLSSSLGDGYMGYGVYGTGGGLLPSLLQQVAAGVAGETKIRPTTLLCTMASR